jgi:hypothetical protein
MADHTCGPELVQIFVDSKTTGPVAYRAEHEIPRPKKINETKLNGMVL